MNSVSRSILDSKEFGDIREDVTFDTLSFEEFITAHSERKVRLEAAAAKTKRELPWIEEGDVIFI
jgi:hypothetical protein